MGPSDDQAWESLLPSEVVADTAVRKKIEKFQRRTAQRDRVHSSQGREAMAIQRRARA
jgi:hypothetical protein